MPRLSKIGAAALAAFGWTSGSAVTASYLQVAGGGGGAGGTAGGGGGGAGGFLTGTASLNTTLSYTVIVGAGGTGGAIDIVGVQGSNSQFDIQTASVGGGGGGYGAGAPSTGGSGGGAGGRSTGSATNGAAGTSGQGNAGGNGLNDSGNQSGGGGGGASAVGGNASGSSTGGAGGAGTASSITGSSVTYAGGGGGAGFFNTAYGTLSNGGLGGAGGGGTANSPGTANLGGGGGGGGGSAGGGGAGAGQNGGSGVVIISYVGAQQFGGGVVTSSGGNTIHTFNTSGTLSPLSSLTANFLVVAGGGGGGAYNGGGGGAGGLRSTVTNTGGGGSLESSLTIDTNSIYTVTVGAGGSGQITSTQSVAGSNSSFLSITSIGGGKGGGYTGSFYSASTGGSGGGSAYGASLAGSGTANQGYAGGQYVTSGDAGASGGGGAGAVGVGGTVNGGNGGVGVAVAISGTSTFYAGGGGGAAYAAGGASSAGTGGNGGGGNGGLSAAGTSGTANTGGGGGGSQDTNTPPTNAGGNGGSGVVIISYAGSTQLMAGGTVTVSGGNVIHTFTSSGYLTPIVLVTNSLRFRASASAYLSRTPTVESNRQKWTFSAWVKRGRLSTDTLFFSCSSGSNSNKNEMRFNSSDQWSLETIVSGSSSNVTTTQVFRDPSAWYHLVMACDTTQATAANRLLFYVNGVQVTAFSATSYPSQNQNLYFNSTNLHLLASGNQFAGQVYADLYLDEVNFIDGQQLTANSFGTSNGLGVWQPIRYGGSYGTNGFYLPFNAGTSSFAGSFNGSNQYLSLTSTSALVVASNAPFTLECFVYGNNFNITTQYPSIVTFPGGYQLYVNSGGSPFVSFYNGSSDVVTGLVKVGVWNHVAVARDGSGNISMWINGIRTSTTTGFTNSFGSSSGTFLINSFNGSGGFVNGSVSNLRFVNGTAVYTPSSTQITVPTSNLTAVTNTALLTLQNATFVDNSTNAFSITNNNGATTGQTYPFGIGIFNDQGPAGNNWTPNNISVQPGSTLDIMTDVPTLTSATVANYGVYNPLNKFSSTTITNGNLLVTNGSSGDGWSTTGSTFAFPPTGKWYAEFTIVNRPFSGTTGIGIVPSNISFVNQSGDSARFAWGRVYFDNSGIIGPSNASVQNTTQAPTYTTGDIISVAFDSDNGTVWWAKNGTWTNSGNPATGTNPAYTGLTAAAYPMGFVITSEGYSSSQISGNWGQLPFNYTPPSGFVRMNTFNIAAPTIGATASTTANKYMNVNLWTGDGSSSRNITGIGFAPDFVWIKNRANGTRFHVLNDIIRGANRQLFSNVTNAEEADTTQLTAFGSDGFTIGNNANVNENTSGIVSWNWRANGAGSTNTAGSINSTVSANTSAGFSIVTFTGNATAGATVGHGLGVAPQIMFVKSRSNAYNWCVYAKAANSGNGQNGGFYLNLTDAWFSDSGFWNNTTAGSSTFTLGSGFAVNGSGATFVAYCFAQVAGYSAFGSYTGNGSSDGPFIFTGFRPRYVLVKITNTTGNWLVWDSARDTYNVVDNDLRPNLSNAESTEDAMDFLSNGFKLRSTSGGWNGSGNTYIYMAFAENPFKYANAR